MNTGKLGVAKLVLIALCFVSTNSHSVETGKYHEVESFPKTLDSDCRGGSAKLYDECGSQVDIIDATVAKAAATGKTALVVYGAEWCVWCFVFDGYIKGNYRATYYQWEHDSKLDKWVMSEKSNEDAQPDAERLNRYVADNFVVAHIEGDHAPDGADAINGLGLNAEEIDFYPFVAALAKTGTYSGHMFGYEVMQESDKRKDSNGSSLKSFDRIKLLNRLQTLRDAAKDQ